MRKILCCHKIFISAFLFWSLLYSISQADFIYTHPEQFKKYNPDGAKGQKYEFVKSYLNALKYLYLNEKQEEKRREEIFLKANSKEKTKGHIENLKDENINYRTARNLLKKYKTSENGLVLKVTDMFADACDQFIELNNRERKILESMLARPQEASWGNFKKRERQFETQYKTLAYERRKNATHLLEASLLVNKVLISSREDKHGEFINLGITSEEREKLLLKIDEIYEGKYYEKLKEGQPFLGASISEIRKILLDKTWGTIDKT